ncbi:MAG: DUF6632 domain-containing protein [Hyphomicrobiales bacterium]
MLLKLVLALVGLAILAGNYLLLPALADTRHATIAAGDQMILGLYQPLAVFLLLAIRNPSASRSLILAFGWSTIAHGAVMTVQSYQHGSLSARALELFIFAAVGVVLLVLAPRTAASVATTAVPSRNAA